MFNVGPPELLFQEADGPKKGTLAWHRGAPHMSESVAAIKSERDGMMKGIHRLRESKGSNSRAHFFSHRAQRRLLRNWILAATTSGVVPAVFCGSQLRFAQARLIR